MNFGDHLRTLRSSFQLTQAELARRLDVSMSCTSKVERGRLHFGDYPSEKFIHKLAEELEADEDELLMLADKVSALIRKRIQQRPSLFLRLSKLDADSLDAIEASLSPKES